MKNNVSVDQLCWKVDLSDGDLDNGWEREEGKEEMNWREGEWVGEVGVGKVGKEVLSMRRWEKVEGGKEEGRHGKKGGGRRG
ncbi:hypothetical protein Tco_0596184 [Tanacetum coccineum]